MVLWSFEDIFENYYFENIIVRSCAQMNRTLVESITDARTVDTKTNRGLVAVCLRRIQLVVCHT